MISNVVYTECLKLTWKRGACFPCILFLLILPFHSILAQPKQELKKIYFENLEIGGGVRPDTANHVRNQVSLKILQFFKSKYTLIDDSVIQQQLATLKKQQKLGCDTEKCYKMIEDNLSPDEKISGRLDYKANKYVLILRLIDVSKGGGISDIKEVKFTENQLDYLTGEITRALLDNSYTINLAGAPAEFEPKKVELGTIEFKEIQGVDLKILKFKSQDSVADNLLSTLSPELIVGDDYFRKKNYELALSTYLNIKNSINSLSDVSKKSIIEYYEGILKRIDNTNINMYSEKLKEIDNRFKALPKSTNLSKIELFIQEYEAVLNKMKNENIKNDDLSKSVFDRISKLELKLIEASEKEAEALYDNYKFTDTLRKYEALQKRVLTSNRLDGSQKSSINQNINKKIGIIRETGTSYYFNQVKTYCDLAEQEMVRVVLKKGKGESVDFSKVKDLLDNARDIIESTRLIDITTLNYYNEKVDSINRTEKVGKKISSIEIGSEEGLDLGTSFSPVSINLFFPGSLHINSGEKVKGNLIRYSFLTSLLLFGGAQSAYQNSVSSHATKDNPILDYYVLRNLPFETGFLYYTNQTSSLNSTREEGLRIANAGNAMGFFALGLYLYSWTPMILEIKLVVHF